LTGLVNLTKLLDMAVRHLSIAVEAKCLQSVKLAVAGDKNPVADRGRFLTFVILLNSLYFTAGTWI
jgi:hypothetical protein